MNLIVDIGNTRTKYAVFDEGDWVECGLGLPEVYDLATTYRKSGKEVNLILSSTGAISAEVREMGHYFRVAADNRDLNYDKFVVKGEVHTMADESYTSHNTTRLDVEGTVKKIMTTEYVQNALKEDK